MTSGNRDSQSSQGSTATQDPQQLRQTVTRVKDGIISQVQQKYRDRQNETMRPEEFIQELRQINLDTVLQDLQGASTGGSPSTTGGGTGRS